MCGGGVGFLLYLGVDLGGVLGFPPCWRLRKMEMVLFPADLADLRRRLKCKSQRRAEVAPSYAENGNVSCRSIALRSMLRCTPRRR